MQDVFRVWNADGAIARQHAGALDLHYGRGRDEMFDFYPAARANAPLWVFLHGGYWQACTKDQHGQFAEGMREHGFSVAMLDYPLSPETPLSEIVLTIRHALQFLRAESGALGFDPTRIHLAGHSAGAHLAAVAAADPHGPEIASVLLLSGVFDLDPLFHLPMGRIIGLSDRAEARRLSPLFSPKPASRVGVALGALETDEFKRQSAEMATAWRAEVPLHVGNCHHFNILEELRRPGPLLDLALRTAAP
jgi:arylformamidase